MLFLVVPSFCESLAYSLCIQNCSHIKEEGGWEEPSCEGGSIKSIRVYNVPQLYAQSYIEGEYTNESYTESFHI